MSIQPVDVRPAPSFVPGRSRDRWVYGSAFLLSAVAATFAFAALLELATPLVRTEALGSVVLRPSAWRNALIGGIGCAIPTALFVAYGIMGWLYPDPVQRRLAIESIGRRSSRARPGSAGSAPASVWLLSRAIQIVFVIAVPLVTLSLWYHDNRVFLAADASAVRRCSAWRGTVTERPLTDVKCIRTAFTRGKHPRPVVAVCFHDGTGFDSRGFACESASVDAFARRVAELAGVPVQSVDYASLPEPAQP